MSAVRIRRVSLGVAAVFVLACDDQAGDEEGDPIEELCGDASRYDEFAVGLSHRGESLTVRFVRADPAPPIRGPNTWTMAVESATGDAVEIEGWQVRPWMPDHGHGSGIPVVVSEGETSGQYVLDPVDLHMAGLWTIDLVMEPVKGDEDTVQFAFCIE